MIKESKIVCLLTIMMIFLSLPLKAQQDSQEDQGQNISPTETYYLYNVGAKKYLYVGNTNGTMASLLYNDLGTPLHIDYNAGANEYQEYDEDAENILDKTIYSKIFTSIFNSGVNSFGLGDDENFHLNLDDDSGNRWLMEKVDGENDSIYTLRYYNKNANRYYFLKAEHSNGTAESDKATNTKVGSETQDPKFVFTRTASDLTKKTEFQTTIDGTVLHTECNSANNGSVTIDNLDGNGHLTNLTELDDQIGFEEKDPYVPEGKYDFILTYVPTGNAKDIKINITPTEPDNWDEEFEYSTEIVSTSDNGSDNTVKTLHLCINVFSYWTNLSVELKPGENSSVLPNIVSYSFSKAPDVPTDIDDYSKWKLVSRSELLDTLTTDNSKVYGADEGDADATFLMQDQGFTKDVDDSSWKTEGNVSFVKSPIADNGDDKSMYANAHITGTGKIYQEFDVPNSGVYQFDAYGFSKGCNTNMYYEYETSNGWSGEQETKALKTLADEDQSLVKDANADNAIGNEFYKESVLGLNPDKYKNTLMIYVPANATKDGSGNYKIRIGFNKTTEASDDYTAIDDIHVHYKGQSAFVLDDSWNETEMTAATKGIKDEGRSTVPVYIKRTFWQGAWNPVVLPVPVTNAQLKATFGDGTYVATPYGLTGYKPTLMRFTLLDDRDLEAGKYYIIYPSNLEKNNGLKYIQKGEDGKYVSKEQDKETVNYFLGNIEPSKISSDEPGNMVNNTLNGMDKPFNSKSSDGGDEEVNVVGSYLTMQLPENPYVFTSGNRLLYYTGKPTSLSGYKFYIVDLNKKATLAKAGFQMEIDNVPTGIKGITSVSDDRQGSASDGIYNLSGEKVSADNTDNLPAGIYIVNGRKFIKK